MELDDPDVAVGALLPFRLNEPGDPDVSEDDVGAPPDEGSLNELNSKKLSPDDTDPVSWSCVRGWGFG